MFLRFQWKKNRDYRNILDSKVQQGLMPTTGQVRFEKYKKEEQFKFINSAKLYPAHLKQNIFKCSAQIQLRKKLMIKCKKYWRRLEDWR